MDELTIFFQNAKKSREVIRTRLICFQTCDTNILSYSPFWIHFKMFSLLLKTYLFLVVCRYSWREYLDFLLCKHSLIHFVYLIFLFVFIVDLVTNMYSVYFV